jgi:hypothetical protein
LTPQLPATNRMISVRPSKKLTARESSKRIVGPEKLVAGEFLVFFPAGNYLKKRVSMLPWSMGLCHRKPWLQQRREESIERKE